MKNGDILIETETGKKFKVIDLGHWSLISAVGFDHDECRVKWLGDNEWVSHKGRSFILEGKK